MKIVLIANSISPHQMPLAYQLVKCLGDSNFRYISTGALTSEREKLGWNNDLLPGWVLRPKAVELDRKEAEQWVRNADVALCGNRDISLFKQRISEGKLTFYMSERWFKPSWGIFRLLEPSYFRMAFKICCLQKSPYFYYLPIGIFAAKDMRKLASLFITHPLSFNLPMWGYFVDPSSNYKPYNRTSEGKVNVLWFGRLLKWKRVDTLIKAVANLDKEIKVKVRLKIIGLGLEEERLKRLVRKKRIDNIVKFSEPVPIKQIREEIKKADICAVTSNSHEGWGVAVNEIMLEGRCCLCSDVAGAGATIVRNGENGLLFKSGNVSDLAVNLNLVIEDEALRIRLANEGRRSILKNWSPHVAAERLLKFCTAQLNGNDFPHYDLGVLSELNVKKKEFKQ